jgi:starch synthase (maltosyl-transferring)
MQHGWVHAPMSELGFGDAPPYEVEDALDSTRYTWSGDRNYVRLDPSVRVAHILKPVRPAV